MDADRARGGGGEREICRAHLEHLREIKIKEGRRHAEYIFSKKLVLFLIIFLPLNDCLFFVFEKNSGVIRVLTSWKDSTVFKYFLRKCPIDSNCYQLASEPGRLPVQSDV
jgi:hypothetical protein